MAVLNKSVENGIIQCDIDSSNLLRSLYNEEERELYLFFKRGGVYRYYPVDVDFYTEFENAESQGKFFKSNIEKNGAISFCKEFKLKKFEIESIEDYINNLVLERQNKN